MTEPAPEPTNADVLEVMKAGFAQLSTAIATTNANVEATNHAVADLTTTVDAVDTKVDAVQTEMREGFAGLKGETALLERYVLGVQRAVTDHLNDPDTHHRHAA